MITDYAISECLFSAHAEVFPGAGDRMDLRRALLRARGGISGAATRPTRKCFSSPRTRRYFRAPAVYLAC